MNESGGAVAGEPEAAEQLTMRWDSAVAPEEDRMLFDGADRSEVERYLRAVDELHRSVRDPTAAAVGSPRRSSAQSPPGPSSTTALQVAMAWLEDKFRHVLVSRANEIDVESLVDLSSLSMSSSLGTVDLSDGGGDDDDDRGNEEESFLAGTGTGAGADSEGSSAGSSAARRIQRSSCRSMRSIREIDLLPPDAIHDIRSIAERMIGAGYGRECYQAYGSACKAVVDACFRHLGVEKLSISDVPSL